MATKPRVVLIRELPPNADARLKALASIDLVVWNEAESLLRTVKGSHGLLVKLTEKIDGELLDAAGSQLKVVSTMSVGYDHVDLEACKARGVRVGNTPDVLTDATAELTIGLVLAVARRFGEAIQAAKDGSWASWTPTWMCGTQLTGKTLGLVGFGRIGVAVAERLKAFKVGKILYSGPRAKPDVAEPLDADYVPFDTLLQQSDMVIVTCALTKETRNLFSRSAFSQMKPSSIFINTARGQIVKQDDLVDALKSRAIAAAGLDVTDPEPLPLNSELLKLDNCIVLPHIGSATNETREAMANLAIDNLLKGLGDEKMPAEL